MAEDFAGSDADSERIVCYCFCTYPLAALRERDLESHPTDTCRMIHFHLPLEASGIITEANMLNYNLWFVQLHEAFKKVRTAAEIAAFQQRMESEFSQIENSLRAAREGVNTMREAYDAEVRRAIKETTSRSLYPWEPEPGSMSYLIWHFREHSSEELFSIDFESPSPLRISIESRIPSLAHRNVHIGPVQSEVEQLRAENARLRLELEAATVGRSIAQATGQAVLACESSLSHGGDFNASQILDNPPAGLDEVPKPRSINPADTKDEKPMFDYPAKEKCIKLESEQSEESSELAEVKDCGKEDLVVKLHIDEVVQPLFEQRSQQICMKLDAAGEVIHYTDGSSPLGWTKCLSAHLGRFVDAEEILNEAIGRQMMQNRGEELQAMENKAALHFHRGQVDECLQACKAVIERYDPSYSELHLTAVYYYVTIANGEEAAQQEGLIQGWVSAVPESDNSVTMVLKTCVLGKIAYNQRNYRKAAMYFGEAQYLLDTVCHRPFLSAMNSFLLARVNSEFRRNGKALKHHNDAETCFSANLSKSLWRAMNLNWMGEAMKQLKYKKRAIEAKKKANELLKDYFPSNIYYADNLSDLADLLEKQRKEEIIYREKARTAYAAHHPTDLKAIQNLMRLGDLYAQRKDTYARANSLLIEANNSLIVNYPSSVEVGINLMYFAELYEKSGRVAEARQFANEAKKKLADFHTEDAKEAVRRAEKIIDGDKVVKVRKCEATSW